MSDKKNLTAEEVARLLNLEPLSREGGMFRRTWQAAENRGGVPLSTAIYFLLTANSYSHLHRLPSDEVYHFYCGDPVELHLLGPEGEVRKVLLGGDLAAGQVPQAVAPAGGRAAGLSPAERGLCLVLPCAPDIPTRATNMVVPPP